MINNKLPSLTIFLGSFLIFGVQPMLGRTLLPGFGGTAAVWTTCLATYQVLLLVGYWYAHRMSKGKCANARMLECGNGKCSNATNAGMRECSTSNEDNKACCSVSGNHSANAESVSGNKAMHIVLLALAVAWVAGFAYGRPWLMAHIGNGAYPALEVLLCVLAFAGLPYVLLSANSTLIQAWVAGGGEVLKFESSKVLKWESDQSDGEGSGQGAARSESVALPSEGTNALTNYRTNEPSSDVYHLYAVSNAGSLLGLLCYPFLVEPFLSLDAQWYGFAGALAVYAGLLGWVAKGLGGMRECSNARMRECGNEKCADAGKVECANGEGNEHPTSAFAMPTADRSNIPLRQGYGGQVERPTSKEYGEERLTLNAQRSTSNEEIIKDIRAFAHSRIRAFLWLALPATSTFLLNAVTAHLSTDVTPIPLLWVALLAAFLVSYIIGFSKIGEKGVLIWCVVAMVPLLFCAYAMSMKGGRGFLFNLIPGILLVLLGSTFLHSWLYRIRPEARLLTRFYLCIAAGGAIGGLLSGIVAPLVFNRVMEYPLALGALALFFAFYAWKNTPKEFRWVETSLFIAMVAVFYFIIIGVSKEEPGVKVIQRQRNFYGCLRVSNVEAKNSFGDPIPGRQLNHGHTMHGIQFQPHYLREKPTSYYGPMGGGFAVISHPAYTNDAPMSVGLIGLGAGTMACWGRTNDTYRFFEINPKVVNIAWNTNYFTYLSDCKAKVTIALGDARRVMTAETNRYDVLIIDAYSGDAIPFHLATKEAFRLYLDRLKPGGILAVHISNWHIDLNPLCKAVAKEFGLQLTGVISQPQGLCSAANWVFIGDRPLPVQGLPVRETDWAQVRDIALPTDACGSLINLVRYGHRPPEKALEIGEMREFSNSRIRE
jgi:hypothetical protein